MQAQVDNAPGDGYASWVWGKNSTGQDAWVEFTFYDGEKGQVRMPPYGGTVTADEFQDIWCIRIIHFDRYGVNGQAYYSYSPSTCF